MVQLLVTKEIDVVVDMSLLNQQLNCLNNTNSITHKTIVEKGIKLPKCSIAKAELLSLRTALEHLKYLKNHNLSPITALCDNKQAVQIANGNCVGISSLSKQALELHQTIQV